MNSTSKPRMYPGPWWLWVAAWTLQGGGLLLADRFDLGHELLQFAVTGVIAALPLALLYLFLRVRSKVT